MPKFLRAKTDGKIEYEYRPRGDQQCGNCAMFVAPDKCTDVAGFIVKHGWCKIWTPKGGKRG